MTVIPFLVREAGLALRCGAGHLGLQSAPGALPRALGFKPHPICKKEMTVIDGHFFFGARGGT